MKNARKITVALGVIVVVILLIALQIAAFAQSCPAPTDENHRPL